MDSEMLVPDKHLSKSIAVPASSLMVILDHQCIPAVVLVVEDEMLLRMCAVDMVLDAGYTPLEALDAAEALAILESRSDVALMCTDIQMPGQMDGMGLAHAVHERWPTIGIIVAVAVPFEPPGHETRVDEAL